LGGEVFVIGKNQEPRTNFQKILKIKNQKDETHGLALGNWFLVVGSFLEIGS